MIQSAQRPLIIAHRGASGYLPEHTLEAKAMAHAQLVDFLEQDVVLTRDDVPIVLHDIHLDTVTDVARIFPHAAREDGRYYAIDLTIEEIRQLTVSERFDPASGQAVFPNRFPPHQGRFRIPTLREELEFIRGLNRSTGRIAGIYPEIKQPQFHRVAGKDISRIVLQVLNECEYTNRDDLCFVQCFDPDELLRIREELGCRMKLIQLLEDRECQAALESPGKLRETMQDIARYADGIGPALTGVFQNTKRTGLADAAHAAGLAVHPWTYRADAVSAGFSSFEDLHAASLAAGVDGVFTDFPDRSRELLRTLTP
ncbi:glycerophosphodiester phosphodiesterase [Planctomicrobium sp. SH661]|uniref:glycerophosphodiester phosphodiesterase n=1 Tax=Planctomicrobium sp. SH661 TaxID=3448124 RepID=UPI003F5BF83A